jgi:hypothetical protein
MRHSRWSAGLVLALFAATACGSASATAHQASDPLPTASDPSPTASHSSPLSPRQTHAKPGQPVPASAVRRLTVIADRTVKVNGDRPVEWATAVVTTQVKAAPDTTLGREATVYLVTIKGHFICDLCSVPSGAHAPTGTYISLVIIATTFRGTAFGIGRTVPVSPDRLGPVTYLAVHPS